MARVQTQYQGRGEQPQAVQAQTIQPIQARFDPNDSGAFQLAKALGAVDTDKWGQRIEQTMGTKEDEEKKKARAFANSVTVDELGKRIKDGKMLPSQSPAFIAALQHIHGENSQATFERDTYSKVQSGELTFKSQQEIDEYLTKGRNQALEGQSKYAITGFDKGYNGFRDKITSANTKMMNEKAVEAGLQQSTDALGNEVLKVTSPEFKGTPADAAKTILGKYKLLTSTSLLRDDARKEALTSVLTTLAGSGQKDLADAILNEKLDNGVTVRSVIGEPKAVSLSIAAEGKRDQSQRQEEDVQRRPLHDAALKGEMDEKALDAHAKKYERVITTGTYEALKNTNRAAQDRLMRENEKAKMRLFSASSEAQAEQNVRSAARLGNLSTLKQQTYVDENGETKTLDHEKIAQDEIATRVAAAKLPIQEEIKVWATNDVESPELAKQIKGGAANIASVGWSHDGKNIGVLNPQGQQAIETFMLVNKTDPKYAERLAGKGYQDLSDIEFHAGFMGGDVNAAATLVNQINRSGIKASDYGSLTKKVQGSVDAVVNPGFWAGKANWWGGLWGNDQVNLTSVASVIRRRAEALVMSGQVPDADAAVQSVVKHLSDPKVTTVLNNTVYFNKDLPNVPAGEDRGKLFERFIREGPGQLAKDQQMGGDVRLEPNQTGGYTAWIGGVPLIDKENRVVMIQKKEIEQWADKTVKSDLNFNREFQDFKNRTGRELAKQPKRTLEQSDLYVQNTLNTPEGFRKIIADGNQNKPVSELYKIYRPKKPGSDDR